MRQRITTVILAVAVLGGCTHTISLPSGPDVDSCPLQTSDARPDPKYLYAQSSAVVQIETTPPIAESIRQSVCASIDTDKVNSASFVVRDYSCTATGFATIKYVAEVRGALDFLGENKVLNGSSVVESGQGYVPAGCEKASVSAIDDLTEKITDTLGSK